MYARVLSLFKGSCHKLPIFVYLFPLQSPVLLVPLQVKIAGRNILLLSHLFLGLTCKPISSLCPQWIVEFGNSPLNLSEEDISISQVVSVSSKFLTTSMPMVLRITWL